MCTFKVTRATSRFFSIEPKNLTFDMEALIKNSESARNSPYVERKHPLGLKLQSSPYGSGTGNLICLDLLVSLQLTQITDGETLAKTLSRYSDIISLISSEITPQPAKTSKRARSQKAEEEVIEADEETHKKKASNKKKVKV